MKIIQLRNLNRKSCIFQLLRGVNRNVDNELENLRPPHVRCIYLKHQWKLDLISILLLFQLSAEVKLSQMLHKEKARKSIKK